MSGWLGVESQAGAGDEAVEDPGAVVEALEPIADQRLQAVQGACCEVGQAVLDMGPDPFCGGSSPGRRPGGSTTVSQSRAAIISSMVLDTWAFNRSPDQNDRRLELLPGCVNQPDAVVLGQRTALGATSGPVITL